MTKEIEPQPLPLSSAAGVDYILVTLNVYPGTVFSLPGEGSIVYWSTGIRTGLGWSQGTEYALSALNGH